ncbi:MAG: glycoside hydrolase family 2 protein [Clostridiales bacterium]|nr:glycoside hydrolase family 2 protein [Clostridiales bacterium]
MSNLNTCFANELQVYNFNLDWKFKKADAFPLDAALEKHRDSNGKYFYEEDYILSDWKDVSVPHTFNDEDAFVSRISDGGTGQARTFSFYRKYFTIASSHEGKKVIIEFEGIRQSAFVYINGLMVGYHENGVGPFAFDLTSYVRFGDENLIAVATDNTATRNTGVCMAETPNKEDVEPGYYMSQLLASHPVPEDRKGVGYLWNCNDFNPSYGGITKNVRLHIKNKVYQTLPIYSNLMTKGVYVYGSNYDIVGKSADIHVEAEVRNESDKECKALLEIVILDHKGEAVKTFSSEAMLVPKSEVPDKMPLSITPEDAYVFDKELNRYVPVDDESQVKPTKTASCSVTVIKASANVQNLRFWTTYDPYLYDVYSKLIVDGEVVDTVKIVTGFRKVSYNKDQGVLINDEPIWLTGYAQRSSNEWAAIGVAPDWLKDFDAQLIKESNANFIRWMHVAASPADIRSCDKYGVVCVQPGGDKEKESHGRQWDQRVELMRDVIIYFRNNPSILFWETGNNAVYKEHMREMTLLKRELDPNGGRFMGCRTISTPEVVEEAEFVGTMLNRHAGRFQSLLMPIVETEYLREESPRRVWDRFSPPDFDYDNLWLGKRGRKQEGGDIHNLTAEEFVLITASAYEEFYNDRVGGVSKKDLYSATAALCWTDSAQHGRQAASENARMSGRVDPVRIKKQSFHAFKTLQDPSPAIMIVGHWNYPPVGGDNYKYPLREFNGTHWVKTGEYDYRDPKNKTVYVIGNYYIDKVELYINEQLVGTCDEPKDSFIFAFEGIDITKSGKIEAKGYDYKGNLLIEDKIETVGEAAEIRLTPVTGDRGLIADGSDIAFFDVEVVDDRGRICPLNFDRIDFTLDGEAVFLGGYNSGRFNGYGRNDSVIHQNHVYAECGTNRVFIRSTREAGTITLTAVMKGLPQATSSISSIPMEEIEGTGLSTVMPQERKPLLNDKAPVISPYDRFRTTEYSTRKYKADSRIYYKVLVNGREVDMKGGKKVYEQTGVFGPIIPVLDDIIGINPNLLSYTYDSDKGVLVMNSGQFTVQASIGTTHLLVNGEENLMNGEPEYHDGDVFCMEINTIVSYIEGIDAVVDENVNLYRITVPRP